MTFFAVFFALLIEQARPLTHQNWVHVGMRAWVRWVLRSLDAGQAHHGALVWGIAVGLPVALTAVVHVVLWSYSVLLTLVWSVAVLYVTLGFRQFSHHFTEVRAALERGDDMAARRALAEWRKLPLDAVPDTDLLKHVIECSALSVHRHVLGVLVCFVVFWLLGLGPAGAVLFRLADYMDAACRNPAASAAGSAAVGGAGVLVVWGARQPSEGVRRAAAETWRWINHVPARATALAFAVVGNFEEAVANWRQEASGHDDHHDGIVLAATAGALNLRMGAASSGLASEPLAAQPQLAHLTSLVGLVWRSVVLWMLFLALVTLARSMG
jgi:adenosylcobinamide-phosphate synthase